MVFLKMLLITTTKKNNMKIILIILSTFVLALFTSALFEINFIAQNPVRYVLIVLLILVEIAVGYFYIKSEVQKLNQK